MNDTLETDALVEDIGMGCEMVDAWFARKLERERNEARTILKGIEQAHHAAFYREGKLKRERDEIAAGMSEFLTPFLQGLFYGVIGALGYSIAGRLFK